MTAIRPGLHNTWDLGRTAKVDLEHGTAAATGIRSDQI
jgi:hypothetical protein